MKHALLALVLLTSCGPNRSASGPNPLDPPDSDLCGKMCQHIGPSGLNCEEGKPIYNSDKPGPKDVPNETCEEFCKLTQERGAFLNPKCVVTAPSCDKIEEYRNKPVETCGVK